MVQSDPPVASLGQPVGRRLGLFETLPGIGQGVVGDHLLVGLHPGHMGIAEYRHPVGPHFGRQIDGTLHVFDGLVWQAVHEIEVDRLDPGRAQPFHHLRRHLVRLDAVDRLLHPVVKILNAQAGPVDAGPRQRLHAILGHGARVHLHRDFRVGRDIETGANLAPSDVQGLPPTGWSACRRPNACA